ncbi:cyclic nucleotide-binding domain-containing protein [Actinomadura flavalba]|uniref:cyclic nucleotide-binding domain-containing protein n=1 Tax=Actinomadura flavalba TaxID=1120938 RepID=UPI00035F29C7|nr:cyclic nucleotide-binding domain-containing protein [Actinomadura flavalba]
MVMHELPRRDAWDSLPPPAPPPAQVVPALPALSGPVVSRTAQNTTFWTSLTRAERRDFVRVSDRYSVPAGRVLWREGAPADHALLIRSGEVEVCVGRYGAERVVAYRRDGSLIGERAALTYRRRSATVVAARPTKFYRISSEDFQAFLAAHPRLLDVLETQVYERLVEAPARPEPVAVLDDEHDLPTRPYPPPRPAGADRAEPAGRRSARPAFRHPEAPAVQPLAPTGWADRMCSVVYTDVAGFGGGHRSDDDRLRVRAIMYTILRRVFDASDVPWAACHREDRGDGALIVVPPEIPPRSLLDPLLAALAAELAEHNHRSSPALAVQLRLALHVGPVTPDAHGVSGLAIIRAARLLEARELKDRMAATGADLGFITTSYVHEHVLTSEHGPLGKRAFQSVAVRVKETEEHGWMRLW